MMCIVVVSGGIPDWRKKVSNLAVGLSTSSVPKIAAPISLLCCSSCWSLIDLAMALCSALSDSRLYRLGREGGSTSG